MLNYPRAPSEPRGQLEKQEKDQRKIKECKSATKSRRRRNNGAITISKGRDPHIRTALPLQTKKVSWRSFALFHRIWTITGNEPCLVAPKEFAFIRAGRRLMPFTAGHIAENRLAFVLNFTPYSIYGNEAGDFLLAWGISFSRTMRKTRDPEKTSGMPRQVFALPNFFISETMPHFLPRKGNNKQQHLYTGRGGKNLSLIYIRGGGEITSHSTPFRVTEPSSARFGRFGCLTTLIKSDPGHTARKQLHWNNLVLRVGSKIGFNVTYNVYWLCLRRENPHRMSMERAIGTPILTEKQKKGKKAPKGTDPKGLNLATPQLIMRWVTITNEHEARSTDGVQKTSKNRKNLVGTYEGMTE